jgi:hypothetical protein
MSDVFIIKTEGRVDGPLHEFGPVANLTGKRLSVPSPMRRQVYYPSLAYLVELTCVFTGQRIEIESLEIHGDGTFINTQYLTQLSLPDVIRAITREVEVNSEFWACRARPIDELRVDDPSLIAQIYWYEHVTWGSPRAALMSYMGWSRTNTNWHLRKIADTYTLPGNRGAAAIDKN